MMSGMKTSPTQTAIDHMKESEAWARIGCYNTAKIELRKAIAIMEQLAAAPKTRAGVRCEHCGEIFNAPVKGRIPSYCSEHCKKALTRIEKQSKIARAMAQEAPETPEK